MRERKWKMIFGFAKITAAIIFGYAIVTPMLWAGFIVSEELFYANGDIAVRISRFIFLVGILLSTTLLYKIKIVGKLVFLKYADVKFLHWVGIFVILISVIKILDILFFNFISYIESCCYIKIFLHSDTLAKYENKAPIMIAYTFFLLWFVEEQKSKAANSKSGNDVN